MTTQLIAVADAYCAATGLSRSRLSTIVLNGGSRLDAIAGGGDLTTGNFERCLIWFSTHWPAAAVWPEGVERPAAREDAA